MNKLDISLRKYFSKGISGIFFVGILFNDRLSEKDREKLLSIDVDIKTDRRKIFTSLNFNEIMRASRFKFVKKIYLIN